MKACAEKNIRGMQDPGPGLDMREVGLRVRQCRRELGMTQPEFAEALNISESQVGCVERGSRALSAEALVRAASLSGASTDWILLGRGLAPGDLGLLEQARDRLEDVIAAAKGAGAPPA